MTSISGGGEMGQAVKYRRIFNMHAWRISVVPYLSGMVLSGCMWYQGMLVGY
jgi:hypothetical protein